jgi:hypothetical protein
MMAEMFYGDWTVEANEEEVVASHRFIIEGAVNGAGVYPGESGNPPVSVSGPAWSIIIEWNDNAGSNWQTCAVRRTSVTFTLKDGLVVRLGADDNYVDLRDNDFNDSILICRKIDPQFTPWNPFVNTYDFTLPNDVRRKARGSGDLSRSSEQKRQVKNTR